MDKKILWCAFIALISFVSFLFLYFYSLENAQNYWNVNDSKGNAYTPIVYLTYNIEKFKGKEIYLNMYVELKDNKIFIPYRSIYPTKEKIKIEVINSENFQLENEKRYGFEARLIDVKTDKDVKMMEIYVISKKSQQLIDIPWTIYGILLNVSAVFIMVFLLLKLKINFKRILINP